MILAMRLASRNVARLLATLCPFTKVKSIVLPAVFIFFSGCSVVPVSGSEFGSIVKPIVNPEKATVFLYRRGRGPVVAFGAVDITMDGKPIFGLKDTGFTWLYIEPGLHSFKAEWPYIEKPRFEEAQFDPKLLMITLQAGKTYYVNYRIEQEYEQPIPYLEPQSLIGMALLFAHTKSVALINEKEKDALQDLKWCKYQSNTVSLH